MSNPKLDITLNPVIDDNELKKAKKKIQDTLENENVSMGLTVETSGVTEADDGIRKVNASLDEMKAKLEGSQGVASNFMETFFKFEAIGQAGEMLSNFAQSGLAVRDALLNVQAQAGLTTKEVATLRENAEGLFKAGVGENLSETIKALGTAQQQLGNYLSEGDLTIFTKQAAAIGQVFDKDVNEVLSKSRTFIAQFGLDGAKAADLVSFAMQKGGSAMDDVLDTMDEYSQLARLAGYNAEEFISQITQATQLGLRDTDKLADSIKETQIRINAGDYKKPFEDMIEASKGAEKQLQNNVLAILNQAQAGDISIKEALTLSATAIKDAFDAGEITAAMRDQLNVAISGTMAEDIGGEMWTKIFSTPIDTNVINQQAKLAGDQVKNALGPITFFESVTKELQLFATNASETFGKVAQSVGGALSGIAQIAPALTLIGNKDLTSGLSDTFKKVSDSAKSFAANLGKINLGGGFVNSIKTLGTTLLTALTPSFMAAGSAGAAAGTATTTAWAGVLLPILGIVAAVGAVVGAFYLLYKNSEGFKQFIDGVVEGVKELATVVWDNLVSVFTSIWDVIKEPLSYLWDAIQSVGVVVGLFLIAPFWASYEIFKVFFGFVKDNAISIWENLKSAMSSLYDFIAGGFLLVWESVKSAFISVYESVSSLANAVGGVFLTVWNSVLTVFKSLGDFISNVFTAIWNGLKVYFNALIAPIRGVINAIDFLVQSFRSAANVGIYVKGVIAGVSEAATALGRGMANAWNAIKSLDFKGFLNAIKDTPKQIFDAFKNGTTEAIKSGNALAKAAEEQKKKAEEAKKKSEESAKRQQGLISETEKIQKKSNLTNEQSAKAVERSILEQYNAESKILDAKLKNYEVEQERLRLQNDLKKTSLDDVYLEQEKLNKLQQQKVLLSDIVAKAGGAINSDGIIVGAKLNDKEQTELQKELERVLESINSSSTALDTLVIKAGIDIDEAEKQYQILQRELRKEKLEIDLEFQNISQEQFNVEMIKIYQSELKELETIFDELSNKAALSNDPIQLTDVSKQVNQYYGLISAKQKEIGELSDKIWADSQLSRIKAEFEGAEQIKNIRLFLLEQEYQKEYEANYRNQEKINALLKEFQLKRQEILNEFTDVGFLDSFGATFADAFKNINFDGIFAANDGLRATLDELSNSQSELDAQFKDGALSYADYIDKLNSLDDERTEAIKKNGNKQQKILLALNESISASFQDLAVKATEDLSNKLSEMTKAGAGAYDILNATLEQTATIFSATTISMLADGRSLWKAMTLGLLAAVKAQVAVLAVEILGKEIASKSFVGISTGTVLAGLLYGALSAAEAAVKSAKFAKGGLVKGSQQLVTVNELGEEFIFNADTTRKNLAAFQEMNAKNLTVEQYAKNRYDTVDLTPMLERLDNIETAIKKEARFKTFIDANIEVNDKEIIRRADIHQRRLIKRF